MKVEPLATSSTDEQFLSRTVTFRKYQVEIHVINNMCNNFTQAKS
jgi:hypothetical protein